MFDRLAPTHSDIREGADQQSRFPRSYSSPWPSHIIIIPPTSSLFSPSCQHQQRSSSLFLNPNRRFNIKPLTSLLTFWDVQTRSTENPFHIRFSLHKLNLTAWCQISTFIEQVAKAVFSPSNLFSQTNMSK